MVFNDMNANLKLIIPALFLSLLFSQNITNPNGFIVSNEELLLNSKRQQKNAILLLPVYIYGYYAQSSKKADYCQFHPTCSIYGKNMIEKYGLIGWLKTFDRLNRCGHDLHLYDRVIVGSKIRYLDNE